MQNHQDQPKIFIVDNMLKGLARWLRFLGFDAHMSENVDEAKNILNSIDHSVFITASPAHKQKIGSTHTILLQSDHIEAQLNELNEIFHIFDYLHILSLCSICNTLLQSIGKEQVKDKVPEKVYHSFRTFYQCPRCNRIYWYGGHVKRLLDKLKRMNVPVDNSKTGISE
ncbi:MAG: hypothetical protein JXL67_11420 [Calditrichaeota bacterium]|nr:hypothetical protein [Calditrichota bacterium]